jgi:hypothetical protein
MVVHQAHYFVYAYVLLWVMSITHGLSTMVVALAFAAGWVSYTLSPRVLAMFRPASALMIGHVANALLLATMAVLLNNAVPFVALWVLTGLGGGSVYALRQLARSADEGLDGLDGLDRSELIGHLVGVVLAIGLAALAGPRPAFAAGAALAACVAAASWWRLGSGRDAGLV